MSSFRSVRTQMFPPKATWSVDQIPDLTGRVVLITGGNSGVGYETAKAVLSRNAKVYIACRSPDKANAAIKSLAASTGKTALFLQLDLANLTSIKATVEEFKSEEEELHILFNNAGVMFPSPELLTADSVDLTFGTNVLGHYYLTMLLLPLLQRAAAIDPAFKARVVTTSSMSSEMVSTLDFDTFIDTPKRTKTDKDTIYNQSKLANVIFANELARRYGDLGIVSSSVNPGVIRTDLQRNLKGPRRFIVNRLLQPASMGALTQLYAGTSLKATELNGKYLVPWARIYQAPAASEDKQLATRLWNWMEDKVKGV